MSPSILIDIDINQMLAIVSTIVGCAWTSSWYISGRFSRIDQRLIHLEKVIDEMKVDLKEISRSIK